MGQQGEASLREELAMLANAGVSIQELDAPLKQHDLSRDEYDELWLYAWMLLERHASRTVIDEHGDWVAYGEVEAG